jgi:hypothetical protein
MAIPFIHSLSVDTFALPLKERIMAPVTHLSLWWLREVFWTQRSAAIVHRNTLKAGLSGVMTPTEALISVEASLGIQVVALESLMGLSSDD